MELKEARKQLRELGFKIKTERLTWGRHATIVDSDGRALPSLLTREDRAKWQPAIDWRNGLDAAVTSDGERIYGLTPNKRDSN